MRFSIVVLVPRIAVPVLSGPAETFSVNHLQKFLKHAFGGYWNMRIHLQRNRRERRRRCQPWRGMFRL